MSQENQSTIFSTSNNKLKLYILVKESIPLGLAVNSVAHASMALYIKYKDHPIWNDYMKSFRKVTCIVTNEQFEKAKQYSDHIVMTESALDNQETAIAFLPREEWSNFFKFLKLYGR